LRNKSVKWITINDMVNIFLNAVMGVGWHRQDRPLLAVIIHREHERAAFTPKYARRRDHGSLGPSWWPKASVNTKVSAIMAADPALGRDPRSHQHARSSRVSLGGAVG
jgi:hypothetical protein